MWVCGEALCVLWVSGAGTTGAWVEMNGGGKTVARDMGEEEEEEEL